MIDFKEKAEIVRIEAAIDAFATQMKAVMREKAKQGKRGWNNKPTAEGSACDGYILHEMSTDVLAVGRAYAGDAVTSESDKKFIDIANRCMILWFRHNEDRTAAR